MTSLSKERAEVSTDHHIDSVVSLSRLMLNDVLESVQHISNINRATRILSMNARIEAARAGTAGVGFGVVAQELTNLSNEMADAATRIVAQSRTTGMELNRVIEQLSTQVRDDRLSDLAHANIDLIDRNLYERSCDVRWWATDSSVCACLLDSSHEARRYASLRLGQILDSYTVYFDLALADLEGRIVANGRNEKYHSLGQNVARTQWFTSALATTAGTEFGFESVHPCSLVNGQLALVYSCVVREGGRVNGKPLGVLGIVFAWEALSQTIVLRTPLSAPEWECTRVCVVDQDGLVLADSTGKALAETLQFEERDALFNQSRGAVTADLGAKRVRIAHAKSMGYETYRTGWHSLLIRQLVDEGLHTATTAFSPAAA
jgi:Methyl-accepting chemotaxis protein (MCP) signalling domain